MNLKLLTRWTVRTLGAGLMLLLTAAPGRAGLLQFQLGTPVVFSGNGSLTYNATTGEFQSTLTPLTYNSPSLPGGFVTFSGQGQTTIDLFVNHNGNFQNNGTGFTLTGQVTLGTHTFNDTLLTGDITAFGADAAGPPTRAFNGLFTITGGQLTQNNGGFTVGETGGFILFAENVTSGTLGDFTQSFTSSSVKGPAGPAVSGPEPATLLLGLVGVGGLLLAGRGRKRRRRAGVG
jgi:hypothetical protein